jgi:predicted kinase
MQTIHVMTGLPGSGKSTIARSMGIPRFNLDDTREMMGFTGANWSSERERQAVKAMVQAAHAVASMGTDIVIDNTHLTKRLPKLYMDTFYDLPDAIFDVHDLTGTPIETCIERDAQRTVGHVGEGVIMKLAKSMEGARKGGWRLTSEWMNARPVVQPYTEDPNLPWCVIFDIDGTLALHVERGPYEFEKLETDAVNRWVADIVELYRRDAAHSGVTVIFLSGRKGEFRDHTVRWLTKNELFYGELHMRPVGDPGRSDDIVKLELFNQYIRGRYNVAAVYDDRNRVVNLWRSLGLGCAQVAPGAF